MQYGAPPKLFDSHEYHFTLHQPVTIPLTLTPTNRRVWNPSLRLHGKGLPSAVFTSRYHLQFRISCAKEARR
jgi:hypothetical protein